MISFKKSPQVTESNNSKYSYPFGVGMFLITGCFQYSKHRKLANQNYNSGDYMDYDYQENTNYRRKRSMSTERINTTTDMTSFCDRYSKLEYNFECKVLFLS